MVVSLFLKRMIASQDILGFKSAKVESQSAIREFWNYMMIASQAQK